MEVLNVESERSRRIREEQPLFCAGHAFLSGLAKVTPVLRTTVWVLGPKRCHVSLRLKTHHHEWYVATAERRTGHARSPDSMWRHSLRIVCPTPPRS